MGTATALEGDLFLLPRGGSSNSLLTPISARAILALLSGRTRTSRRAVAAIITPYVYVQMSYVA